MCTLISDKGNNNNQPKTGRSIQKPMWEFLLEVLADPLHNPSVLSWVDKKTGSFKIEKPQELADLWTKARNRTGELKYEFFARALRLVGSI